MDIIEKNITYPWDYEYISRNPNINMKFINNFPNKYDWKNISKNIMLEYN